MHRFFIFSILVLLTAVPLSSPIAHGKEPGMTPLFLYDPSTGDIKTRCIEMLGKYDISPHYECYDENEILRPFDTGKKWQPINLTPACLRHAVSGAVKNCVAYQLKPGSSLQYACHDRTAGKYVSFDIDRNWRELKENDPACARRTFGPDVIRDFEFELKGAAPKKKPAQTGSDFQSDHAAEATK